MGKWDQRDRFHTLWLFRSSLEIYLWAFGHRLATWNWPYNRHILSEYWQSHSEKPQMSGLRNSEQYFTEYKCSHKTGSFISVLYVARPRSPWHLFKVDNCFNLTNWHPHLMSTSLTKLYKLKFCEQTRHSTSLIPFIGNLQIKNICSRIYRGLLFQVWLIWL